MALSHGSLPLYRKLQFLGSCTFNVFMSVGSIVSVVIYEQLGHTAPFHLTAGLCVVWSVVVALYFLVRHRGMLSQTFQAAEAALLSRGMTKP
eukprot:COSAG02_NODE_3248_length_7097_cov_2.679194_3_plen_92_part_00